MVYRNVEGKGTRNKRKSIGKISMISALGLNKISVTPARNIGREKM